MASTFTRSAGGPSQMLKMRSRRKLQPLQHPKAETYYKQDGFGSEETSLRSLSKSGPSQSAERNGWTGGSHNQQVGCCELNSSREDDDEANVALSQGSNDGAPEGEDTSPGVDTLLAMFGPPNGKWSRSHLSSILQCHGRNVTLAVEFVLGCLGDDPDQTVRDLQSGNRNVISPPTAVRHMSLRSSTGEDNSEMGSSARRSRPGMIRSADRLSKRDSQRRIVGSCPALQDAAMVMPASSARTSRSEEGDDLARAMEAVIRAREERGEVGRSETQGDKVTTAGILDSYKAVLPEKGNNTTKSRDNGSTRNEEALAATEGVDPFNRIRDSVVQNDLSASEAVSFLEGYLLHKNAVEMMQQKMADMEAELQSLKGSDPSPRKSSRASASSTASGESLKDSTEEIHHILKRIGAAPTPKTSRSGTSHLPMRTIKEDTPIEEGDNGSSRSITRINLRDTLKLTKTKKKVINQSCKTLSMKRILNDPDISPDTERVVRELMEVEHKQKKLEKQLQAAGVTIAEDIPYEEAKRKVQDIAKRMGEIGSAEVEHKDKLVQKKLREEYFRLEQDMEKYNNALMLTDEYIKEQEDKEREWEESNETANLGALKKIRRHMPVQVKNTSEAQLSSEATPNGKVLPKAIAKKFKRTDVLMLLRTNPADIERVHPSTLENLRVTGLTLTERRALHEHLRGIGEKWKKNKAEKMTERKWMWFNTMRNNFKENVAQYDRHVAQYGPPGNHPYATRNDPKAGCPLLGRQCPLKADQNPSYDDDYGYPDEAEYVESFVTKADAEDSGAKAKREAQELARVKKANERQDALKKHYKGKILDVARANGSCEAMDEAMDRMEFRQIGWIEQRVTDGTLDGKSVDESGRRKETAEFNDALNELKLSVAQFAEKSGMQLTGKKDANADKGDGRSAIELGMFEEVYRASADFMKGIEDRMEQIKAVDGMMKNAIKQLRELLDELHERSLNTLKTLGVDKLDASRKWKSREELLKEAKEKLGPEEEEVVEEVVEDYGGPPRPPNPMVGGLMNEIAGRGGGGRGRGGGRGDLLGAIAARGGGRGRGGRDAGGRGDLLGAIAARGGRGGRGGRDSGGMADLMGAIAARGRGGGDGRDSGGRGDLMSVIAARGRGGGGGRDSGGRGDLMSASAARGRGSGSLGGGGRDDGGRGDLMSAIAARGKGGGGRGGSSTRGGLVAEIAAGCRGGGGGQGNGSGRSSVRGGLMAEIAGRGRRGGGGRTGGSALSGGRGDLMAEIAARRQKAEESQSSEGSDQMTSNAGSVSMGGKGPGGGSKGGGPPSFLEELKARAAQTEE